MKVVLLMSILALAGPNNEINSGPADAGAAENAQAEAIVARVNGEALYLEDLAPYLQDLHQGATTGKRRDFDPDRLIFRMVSDLLLSQEARAMGLNEEEPIPNQVRHRRDRLVLDALLQEAVNKKIVVQDEEVRKVFESQQKEVSLQVVTADERDQAEAWLEELRGGADMETMARERSVDPYSQRGGHVLSVPRTDLQHEIAELVLDMEPGAFGGPVRTDLGWSVLRLEELKPADPARFKDLERTLRQVVAMRRGQEIRANFAAEVRRRHPVVFDDVIGELEARRLSDGRLRPGLAVDGKEVAADFPVARVGQKLVVTADEYRKALLARWSSVRNAEAALAAAPIVLDRLVEKKLFLAEGLAQGYDQRPKIAREVRSFENGLLVKSYLQSVIAGEVDVNREEMLEHYNENRDAYRKPPVLRLGQITVEERDQADEIARLLRDGTDLAWLAQRHSIDRFKEQGGDRGTIVVGSSDFDARLNDAEPGAVLDPTGVPGNWVVLKVLGREDRGHYAFDEVSGNVRQAVYQQKAGALIEGTMDILRERSEIEVNEALVASLRLTGERSEEGGRSGH